MKNHTSSAETPIFGKSPSESASPACILVANANDPSGAGGLTSDIATVISVGGHGVSIVTGSYIKDTTEIFDYFSTAETDKVSSALDELGENDFSETEVRLVRIKFLSEMGN